ncbi:MAG: tetratricopeptide repeat protein, partial [Myxococcales bacterium]|nr:tetratricopeptide repeat protein [Myxococcales bacterium]
LALAGRLDDALKRTDAALSGARTLAYAPVIAEASLREGAIHLELGHGQEAEASLTEAIEGGITARADRVAAEGLARRMFVRAELLQDVARAQLDVPLARSFAERFQGDGALQWLYLNNLGVVHHDAGDLERARALYEQAAAIDAGPTELERAFTRLNIGLVEIERGELAAASATMDQARASIEEVLGPAHPIIGGVLEQEGRVALDRGQRAEAITLLTRAVEILKDSDNVRAYGWPLHDLARLDLEGEAWEAARAKTDELLAAIDPDDPGQAALWANVRALDGDVLARTGDRAAAQRAYDEALTYLEGKVGREHGDTAELLGKIGAGLRELGEPALAVEHLRRALTLEQKIRGERSPTYAKALRRLAEAERDAGSLDDALAHAHAARALLKATVGIDAPEYRRAAQTYTQINMIRARAAKRSRVYHAEAATAARPP